jgi:hypothetical protein
LVMNAAICGRWANMRCAPCVTLHVVSNTILAVLRLRFRTEFDETLQSLLALYMKTNRAGSARVLVSGAHIFTTVTIDPVHVTKSANEYYRCRAELREIFRRNICK